MTDIAELGFRADTASLSKAEADLNDLTQATQRAERQTQTFGRQASRSFALGSRGANRFSQALSGQGFRNATLQLNQVIQQTTATGNAFQALAIQLPDLFIGFGTLGVVAGAVGGALLPLAANALGAGDAAKQADEALDDFVSSLDEAVRLAQLAVSPIDDLRSKFGEFADEVQRGAQIAAQAALSQALREFGQATDGIGQSLDDITNRAIGYQTALDNLATAQNVLGERTVLNAAQFDEFDKAVAESRDLLNSAAAEIGLTALEAVKLEASLRNLGSAQGMQAVAQAASETLDLFGQIFDESENIPPEVAQVAQNLQAVLEAASAGVSAFDDMGDAASRTADEAGRIAQNLELAARGQAILSASRNNPDFFDPRNESGLAGETDENLFNPPLGLPGVNLPPNPTSGSASRRRGGGGASQADRALNNALRERDSILNGLRTAQDEYNEGIAQADRLLDQNLLTYDQYIARVDQLRATLHETEFGQVANEIDSISQSMADAIVQGEDLGDAMRNIMQQIASDILASGIRQALSSVFSVPNLGRGGGGLFGGLFAGLFDTGGNIPRGQFGIVGERGPEIVTGPAHVTSRQDTARIMGQGGTSRVEIVLSPELLGEVLQQAQSQSVQITSSAMRQQNRLLSQAMQRSDARGTSA